MNYFIHLHVRSVCKGSQLQANSILMNIYGNSCWSICQFESCYTGQLQLNNGADGSEREAEYFMKSRTFTLGTINNNTLSKKISSYWHRQAQRWQYKHDVSWWELKMAWRLDVWLAQWILHQCDQGSWHQQLGWLVHTRLHRWVFGLVSPHSKTTEMIQSVPTQETLSKSL